MNIPPKILIVEDDRQLRDMYIRKLTFEKFNPIGAEDGTVGLQLAKSEHPDLILLDVMLPGNVNGFDLLEQIKRDSDLMNIPVIMSTNLNTEEIIARNIGAVDYLVKANTSLDDVVAKIKQHLEKKE